MRNTYTIIKHVKCRDGKIRHWAIRTSNFRRKKEIEHEKVDA